MFRASGSLPVSTRLLAAYISKLNKGGAAGFSKSTTIVFEDSNVSQKHPKPQPDGSGVSVGNSRAETEGDNKANLPFFVNRSRTGNLPVYTDYKNGRKTVLTQIRKIDGDIMAMERMLRSSLQEPKLHSRVDEITKSITLYGNYRKQVAQWLKNFGF